MSAILPHSAALVQI